MNPSGDRVALQSGHRSRTICPCTSSPLLAFGQAIKYPVFSPTTWRVIPALLKPWGLDPAHPYYYLVGGLHNNPQYAFLWDNHLLSNEYILARGVNSFQWRFTDSHSLYRKSSSNAIVTCRWAVLLYPGKAWHTTSPTSGRFSPAWSQSFFSTSCVDTEPIHKKRAISPLPWTVLLYFPWWVLHLLHPTRSVSTNLLRSAQRPTARFSMHWPLQISLPKHCRALFCINLRPLHHLWTHSLS